MRMPMTYSGETFKGYPVVGRCSVPKKGSEEWNLINAAIIGWKNADPCLYEKTIIELEIERDFGVLVHATPRC